MGCCLTDTLHSVQITLYTEYFTYRLHTLPSAQTYTYKYRQSEETMGRQCRHNVQGHQTCTPCPDTVHSSNAYLHQHYTLHTLTLQKVQFTHCILGTLPIPHYTVSSHHSYFKLHLGNHPTLSLYPHTHSLLSALTLNPRQI